MSSTDALATEFDLLFNCLLNGMLVDARSHAQQISRIIATEKIDKDRLSELMNFICEEIAKR